VRYFFLTIALLITVISEAQLTAPGSIAVRYTSYLSAPSVKHPVFIFCSSSGTQRGSLNASSPGGTGPFTFAWYRWSDATRSFSVPVKTDTGVTNSTATNLDEGGYRVNITNGSGYSASLTGWIFLDSPHASAKLRNFTCDYVALSGVAAVDTFYYRDINNGSQIRLPNKVRFLWSSDPSSSIPYPEIELNPQTFNPPLENVTYNLHVTDSFTCSNESSFYYESIHVKADFSVDPGEGGAPLEVTFTDKSVRAAKYKWLFGDDSVSFAASPDPHTYYIPGEYEVKLIIESTLHCIDSMTYESIVVDDSDLQIPNVFTPNGDGMNDIFRIERTSLRYISVDIFTRNGIKVYEFYGDGELLKDWEGWDGNVRGSSVKAGPGVYFYIVKALGWDNIKYDSKEYRGFVYLYR
jgi:gliding motility-associated-like protein